MFSTSIFGNRVGTIDHPHIVGMNPTIPVTAQWHAMQAITKPFPPLAQPIGPQQVSYQGTGAFNVYRGRSSSGSHIIYGHPGSMMQPYHGMGVMVVPRPAGMPAWCHPNPDGHGWTCPPVSQPIRAGGFRPPNLPGAIPGSAATWARMAQMAYRGFGAGPDGLGLVGFR